MRAVVQRVTECRVRVGEQVVGEIAAGLLVYLGVGRSDGDEDVAYLVEKIAGLRVFPDEAGRMNRSVLEAGGAVQVVSQFTLFGDVRRGRRPSYTGAAEPGMAEQLYLAVVTGLSAKGLNVATGRFGASMDVEYVNRGPVTVLVDSQKLF